MLLCTISYGYTKVGNWNTAGLAMWWCFIYISVYDLQLVLEWIVDKSMISIELRFYECFHLYFVCHQRTFFLSLKQMFSTLCPSHTQSYTHTHTHTHTHIHTLLTNTERYEMPKSESFCVFLKSNIISQISFIIKNFFNNFYIFRIMLILNINSLLKNKVEFVHKLRYTDGHNNFRMDAYLMKNLRKSCFPYTNLTASYCITDRLTEKNM